MSLARKPAAIAASVALAAGGGGAAVLTSSAGASTVTPRAATAHTHTAKAETGTGTFTIIGPKGKTRTRDVKVGCRVADGRYVVSSGTRRHRVRLVVADYTGAGSYTGTAVVSRHSAAGSSRYHYTVPVTLTATGGSASYAKTLGGKRDATLKGKTVSATASWTCSV